MDLEVASEFVTMAAHLVYIKTRMLLSIHDEEATSEMEQLIASLEEHQRNENYLQDQGDHRLPAGPAVQLVGRDYLTKVPETISARTGTYRYVHDREDLHQAMNWLSWSGADRASCRPRWPPLRASWGGSPTRWRRRQAEISARLIRSGVTRFRALFRGSRSRSEVVATFLAVLELCKAHRLRLAGTEEDCTITSTQGEQGDHLEVTADSFEF